MVAAGTSNDDIQVARDTAPDFDYEDLPHEIPRSAQNSAGAPSLPPTRGGEGK